MSLRITLDKEGTLAEPLVRKQTAGYLYTELDDDFRMTISHMQLGYEDNMPLEEFNKMIKECVNVAKKYIQNEHKCEGCETIIYYKSYCDNCTKLWES